MTVQITWQDLQYEREELLFNKLQQILEKLAKDFTEFSHKTMSHEKEFFKFLSHAIKIDDLPQIKKIVHEVNRLLNIDYQLNIFMFQAPTANAMCLPRYGIARNKDYKDTKELVILVSQHFLNDLTYQEQLGILGHELGHLLYGHVHIPAKVILESQFNFEDIKNIKNDVLSWLICAEVSCDIIGFLSCQRDKENFFQAMLKFTAGLSDEIIHVSGSEMIELILTQFQEISSSMFDAVLTTHPLTPLRLKIIDAIADCDLIKHFGEEVEEEELALYKQEFNSIIDEEIRQIYPELIPTVFNTKGQELFMLCVAVAYSDGKITHSEILAIEQILELENRIDTSFIAELQQDRRRIKDKIKEIVDKAASELKEKNVSRVDIVGIVRQLIIIAASDNNVEEAELDTIYMFAEQFNISKQELIFLLQQLVPM